MPSWFKILVGLAILALIIYVGMQFAGQNFYEENAIDTSSPEKTCGSFPDEEGALYVQYSNSPDDSTTFIDLPIYPRAVKLAQTGTPVPSAVLACARATELAAIVSFYRGVAGTSAYELPAGSGYEVFGLPSVKVIEKDNPSRASLNVLDAGGGDLLLLYHLK